MTSTDLQTFAKRNPFVPFKIYVSDGAMHEIRHRELIWVGLGMAVLVVPQPNQADDDKPMIERTIYIDPRHIVKVETESPQPA